MYSVTEDVYNYTILGKDYIHLSATQNQFTLAVFNLFGTLIWGDNGALESYENIILSSPTIKENLIDLHSKGYSICIIEQCPVKDLLKMKQVIDTFYLSLHNQISIYCFFYSKYEPALISDGLLSFFRPKDKKFGTQSFYCGDDLEKRAIYPWYRKQNKDGELAKALSFPIYEPDSIIGRYTSKLFFANTLYITCGQEYSGIEIELEGFRERKQRGEYYFRYKYENGVHLYALTKEDLDLISKDDKKLYIQPNESFIVFGNHPTFSERENMRSKFCGNTICHIKWYAIYPYKKSKSYSNYIKNFQNPLQCGELFLRVN